MKKHKKHTSSGAAGNDCFMNTYTYNIIVDCIIPLLGIFVSMIACLYTIKTYKKSHNILDAIQKDRIWKWNKQELEYLFSNLPIYSIDSFFETPNIIRNELWWGLHKVDLNTFQFIGEEKESIMQLINGLDAFCVLNYRQTPSNHWKFEPLLEQEPFDVEKENQEIKRLGTKASKLWPLYETVKSILLSYQVDLKKINRIASENYFDSISDE